MSIQNTMGIPLSMRLRLAATLSVFLVCSSIATAGPAELLEEIARLEKDAGLSTPAREEALERAVLNLTDVAPTAEVKALVAQMEQRPVRVYVALNEGRARVMVPVYDVASTARVVRQSWVERSAHDLATQLLGSGGGLGEAITDPRGATSPQAWSRGLVAAIDAVPVQQLHMTEAAVAPKVGYSLPADRAALAVAQRLGSAGLFGRILDFRRRTRCGICSGAYVPGECSRGFAGASDVTRGYRLSRDSPVRSPRQVLSRHDQ
jgi:hypothetical protein